MPCKQENEIPSVTKLCLKVEGSSFWICLHGQGLSPTLDPKEEECSRSSLVKSGMLSRAHSVSMGLR